MAPRYRGGAEIHHRLIEGGAHDGARVRVRYETTCDELESLQTRLQRRDPTMGLIDPTRLVRCGGDARDVARVALRVGDDAWSSTQTTYPVYIYLAHLVREENLLPAFDDDSDDADDDRASPDPRPDASRDHPAREPPSATDTQEAEMDAFFVDGSFTGTLIWDAAVHAAEHILATPEWTSRLRDASVVELGCGVGLLSLVAARCGCRVAALTDRATLEGLCEDNIAAWRDALDRETAQSLESGSVLEGGSVRGRRPDLFAAELEWTNPASAASLLARLGTTPDVVFAADCVFQGLFGHPAPLLRALESLCGDETVALVACERRPEDGLDAFDAAARATFDVRTVRAVGRGAGAAVGDVVIREMRRRPRARSGK